jgi:hypothetical protein
MRSGCLRTLKGLHEETEYKVMGREECSATWTPLRGLREGCATSPILFNVYHAEALRQAARRRQAAAAGLGRSVGIEWRWVPGNSLPPNQIRPTNSAAEDITITESLFADDTTLLGMSDEMAEGKEVIKEGLKRFEEKCHDGKEEHLAFADPQHMGIRMLGSWIGRKEDCQNRLRRAGRAWFIVKKRLKGSKLSRRMQARIVEACVESTLLFDCAVRPWYISELGNLQRLMDRAYRFVWMRKNAGPALIQMESQSVNMYGVRKLLGVDSIRLKVEKRCLERLGHVLRMPNDRMTKKITLGWMKQQPEKRRGGQSTISYWRHLVKECNLDSDMVERCALDRRSWKSAVNKRMKVVRSWEAKMADRHRGATGPKPQRSQFNAADHRSTVCDWDGCGKVLRSVAGLKQHQRRTHKQDRMQQFPCRICVVTVLDCEASRTNHERVCGGSERGRCPYCDSQITVSNMARHRKSCARRPRDHGVVDAAGHQARRGHQLERGVCDHCGREVAKTNLSRHQKTTSCQLLRQAGAVANPRH